jgi:hypothetical protein
VSHKSSNCDMSMRCLIGRKVASVLERSFVKKVMREYCATKMTKQHTPLQDKLSFHALGNERISRRGSSGSSIHVALTQGGAASRATKQHLERLGAAGTDRTSPQRNNDHGNIDLAQDSRSMRYSFWSTQHLARI